MAARTTWRWMFWSTSIFQVVMIVVSWFTFRETNGALILRRRAQRLRQSTGISRYYTESEWLDGNRSTVAKIGRALSRPLRLLAFHPIIQVTALVSAFNYGILYIVLSTFSDLWITHYHQSVEISGLHYIAIAAGELAGSLFGGPLIDFLYRRRREQDANAGASHRDIPPEFRLPLLIPCAVLASLGLFWYGWTAEYFAHWAAVDAGVFVLMLGMQIGGMPITAYIIDSYPEHTSSAMAATQFAKSLTAFLFPLFSPSMYRILGYGWANSTLGLLLMLLGIPLPLIVWKFGARLRARAASSY